MSSPNPGAPELHLLGTWSRSCEDRIPASEHDEILKLVTPAPPAALHQRFTTYSAMRSLVDKDGRADSAAHPHDN